MAHHVLYTTDTHLDFLTACGLESVDFWLEISVIKGFFPLVAVGPLGLNIKQLAYMIYQSHILKEFPQWLFRPLSKDKRVRIWLVTKCLEQSKTQTRSELVMIKILMLQLVNIFVKKKTQFIMEWLTKWKCECNSLWYS